ncbi:hypothetical protein E3N88_25634 [Mikania micrantha]|uniref:Uncharacterized protein n=1 Tax=Mikania micrantha TaxID=192012 RepID=A0A5N6N6Q5_9ASTR|nr:hypothetical protein E3N88_25634 [Mikania micrantha]
MKMKKTALEMDAAINGWLEDHKKRRNYASTLQVDESKDQEILMAALLRRVEEAAKEELYGFNVDDVVKSTCLERASSKDKSITTQEIKCNNRRRIGIRTLKE